MNKIDIPLMIKFVAYDDKTITVKFILQQDEVEVVYLKTKTLESIFDAYMSIVVE